LIKERTIEEATALVRKGDDEAMFIDQDLIRAL